MTTMDKSELISTIKPLLLIGPSSHVPQQVKMSVLQWTEPQPTLAEVSATMDLLNELRPDGVEKTVLMLGALVLNLKVMDLLKEQTK